MGHAYRQCPQHDHGRLGRDSGRSAHGHGDAHTPSSQHGGGHKHAFCALRTVDFASLRISWHSMRLRDGLRSVVMTAPHRACRAPRAPRRRGWLSGLRRAPPSASPAKCTKAFRPWSWCATTIPAVSLCKTAADLRGAHVREHRGGHARAGCCGRDAKAGYSYAADTAHQQGRCPPSMV